MLCKGFYVTVLLCLPPYSSLTPYPKQKTQKEISNTGGGLELKFELPLTPTYTLDPCWG